MFEEEKLWDDVKMFCEGIGVYLVKIEFVDENIFLLNSFLQLLLNDNNCEVWIGFLDKKEEGYFVWIDGVILEYINWVVE